jgi:hypothetical protein
MSAASWNEDKSSAEGNQRAPATASDTPVRVAGGGESGPGRSAQYRAVLAVGILALWLVLTGALGALPVLASGLIFLHKGWFFFPTTLLQKGNFQQSSTLWEYIVRLAGSVFAALHDATDSVRQGTGAHWGVLLGLILLACLYRSVPMFTSRLGVMCALFFGSALLHLEFARLGSFYRYEAYLVCLGLVLFVLLAAGLEWKPPSLGKAMPGWISAASLAIALALLMEPLWDRAVNAYDDTPLASRYIIDKRSRNSAVKTNTLEHHRGVICRDATRA